MDRIYSGGASGQTAGMAEITRLADAGADLAGDGDDGAARRP